MSSHEIIITLKKGYLHERRSVKECIRVLGLRKIGQTVVRSDNPALRGIIKRAQHVLKVQRKES